MIAESGEDYHQVQDEDDESIDNEIDSLIYVGSASFLPTDTSLETRML